MKEKLAQNPRSLKKTLQEIGQQLRNKRKSLGINSTTVAEASGLSRVTLYRIEKGESTVAVGAYLSVILALGLSISLFEPQDLKQNTQDLKKLLKEKIRIDQYPQLKRLAWQLKDTTELNPQEVLDLYERNWKHIDFKKLKPSEKKFINQLLTAFGRERLLV